MKTELVFPFFTFTMKARKAGVAFTIFFTMGKRRLGGIFAMLFAMEIWKPGGIFKISGPGLKG